MCTYWMLAICSVRMLNSDIHSRGKVTKAGRQWCFDNKDLSLRPVYGVCCLHLISEFASVGSVFEADRRPCLRRGHSEHYIFLPGRLVKVAGNPKPCGCEGCGCVAVDFPLFTLAWPRANNPGLACSKTRTTFVKNHPFHPDHPHFPILRLRVHPNCQLCSDDLEQYHCQRRRFLSRRTGGSHAAGGLDRCSPSAYV